MQTSATYNPTVLALDKTPALRAAKTSRVFHPRLLRTLAHRWDMASVVALMASSAAYGVYALSHLAGF